MNHNLAKLNALHASLTPADDIERMAAEAGISEVRGRVGANELLQRFATLVLAAQQPAAIPPGYALVPLQPTAEMIEAGERYVRSGNIATEKYRAMLAAAPAVPAASGSTPRVDALTAQWADDGATRGPAYIAMRDLARELEARQPAASGEPAIYKSLVRRVATQMGWTPARPPLSPDRLRTIAYESGMFDEQFDVTGEQCDKFGRAIEQAHGIGPASTTGGAQRMPAPNNPETQLQLAAVMLKHGTPEQQREALEFVGLGKLPGTTGGANHG